MYAQAFAQASIQMALNLSGTNMHSWLPYAQILKLSLVFVYIKEGVLLNTYKKGFRVRTLRLSNALGLQTCIQRNALAINVRCTIHLMMLMLLLTVLMLVCHLKHLNGCDSPELPVQLSRAFF